LDVKTGSRTSVTGVDPQAVGLALAPDGKVVYVTNPPRGLVQIVDVATRQVTTISGLASPRNVAFGLSGAAALVTSEFDMVYVTRLPASAFTNQTLVRSSNAYRPDSTAVARLLAVLGGRDAVRVLLSGHSHFDHSFDAAIWAKLTSAAVYGPRTTCYQLVAQDVPASRCTAVQGGETLTLGDGVTVRVVRWKHSGDHAVNPQQHDPTELAEVP